jgi:hypothetical protein
MRQMELQSTQHTALLNGLPVLKGQMVGLAAFRENQRSCKLFVVLHTKIDRIPLQSLF